MKTKLSLINWITVMAMAVLTELMAGCSSVPEASPALKEQALSFKPPPGEGGVYIICPKYFLGWNAQWDIRLDGQKVSYVNTGSYLYTPVWPGEHTLAPLGDDEESDHLNFLIGEGQNGFFTIGHPYSNHYVEVISDEVGENYVRNYKLDGDDFYQLPFLPETPDSAAPVTCHIVLAQNDPFVAAQVEPPSVEDTTEDSDTTDDTVPGTPAQAAAEIGVGFGAGFAEGFGDGIINGLINRDYAAKAKKMSLPLQGHGLGGLFRTNFQSSFVATMSNSPWLHFASVDEVGDTNATVSEITEHPVVQVNVLYSLSPDASSLIAQAQLLYFRQGETSATYQGLYTYISQPVPAKNDTAVTLWLASDQALLRQGMDEGISELMTMMDVDFFHRQKMDPDARSVLAFYYDPSKETQVTRKGFVLRDEGPRIIFQRRPGKIMSIMLTMPPQPLGG